VAALLNERSELDTPELRDLRAAARDARALVDLMAPDTVRHLARCAQTGREIFGTVHLAGGQRADPDKTNEAWDCVRAGTVSLREAMRSDLGLQGMADDDRPRIPG
jgi:hypothetical protein